MSVAQVGRMEDREVLEVTLRSQGGLEARILTWGAVLRDLVVPGRSGPQRVVLGLEQASDYPVHSPYFGAIVGRYANRIGDARFVLDGRTVELVANENGSQLHGGPLGFGRRFWTIVAEDERSVDLALVSPDGDMGWPGRLCARARYEVLEPAILRIVLEATADAPTPVNLTTHSYYNLDDSPDARDHNLTIASGFVTATDPRLVPTGDILPVAGTRLDFREARMLRGSGPYQTFDLNYVLDRPLSSHPELRHAATLSSPVSGVAMALWTTEPGLQFYDGWRLNVPVLGLGGRRYGAHGGIALEPQRFPDGPNHGHFPPSLLMPGQVSRQTSELRFGLDPMCAGTL